MLNNKQKIFYRMFSVTMLSILLFIAGCTSQDTSHKEIPLDGDTLVEQWRFDSGAAINKTPLRIEDVVVFVPHDGALTGVDATTGELRWQFDNAAKVWERAYTTDGKSVFIGLEGGKLASVDIRSGKLLWEVDLGIDVQVSPLLVDDILYVSTTFVGPGLDSNPERKAKLFALKASNGKELWSFESDNYILQTATHFGDKVYVGGSYYLPDLEIEEGGPMRVYALEAENGASIWAYEALDGFIKKMHATEHTVAYVAYEDFVNGIDAKTGDLSWRGNTGNWVPSMLGVEDTIYFGSANTLVYAFDTTSGDIRWEYNILVGTFNYVMGSPVYVQNDLYFLTQHGDIMALNRSDGSLLWHISTGITPRDGLTVSDGWLYFGDIDGIVYGYASGN
jgi:outer membrane protein assembly factor BamB